MFLLLAISLCAANPTPFPVYEDWKVIHGLDYGKDNAWRKTIYEGKVAEMQAHNELYLAGDESYWMSANPYTALTSAEFRERMGLRKINNGLGFPQTCNQTQTFSVGDLPASVDWVAKGAVTPIKNQGQCGSCWAFSTTGSIEGAWFLKTGKLVPLSEQDLVACCLTATNQGCGGGLMDTAFQCVTTWGGISSEKNYPYQGVDTYCNYSHAVEGVAQIDGCVDITRNSPDQLAAALVQQPMSIAVDATAWQSYGGGILNDCSTQLDHGVLLVGYTDTYWIVKNSWGSSWGLDGYIHMGRTACKGSGPCGMYMNAAFPNVKNGTTPGRIPGPPDTSGCDKHPVDGQYCVPAWGKSEYVNCKGELNNGREKCTFLRKCLNGTTPGTIQCVR